jgi:nucleoside-diphosphate-sugar epimerase
MDFREADILDLDAMHKACAGVDYVLHQAAIPSVPKSVADPLGSNRANVDGTVNVLVAARDAKVKRVVYAASSSAYGDTPTLPKHEAMPPSPISPYAVAKLASELYMISFYRCYGLETVCLRYFNIFGPRQDPSSQYSGVLARFSRADAARRSSPRFSATARPAATSPTSRTRSRPICWPAPRRQPSARAVCLTAPPDGASRSMRLSRPCGH